MNQHTRTAIVWVCIMASLVALIASCTIDSADHRRHIRAIDCMKLRGNWLETEGKCLFFPVKQGGGS